MVSVMRTGGRSQPLHQLLRVFEGVEGTVEIEAVVEPRFDYGSLHPWLNYDSEGRVFSAVGGDDALVLSSEAPLEIDRERVRLQGILRLEARQRCRFSLVACPPHEMELRAPTPWQIDWRLRSTIAWWRRWVRQGHFEGEFRETVVRSSLVLKMLTCAPTGAIVAAPTTSLPESLGGDRNWDYRYCWIRDATLAMGAMLATGHPEVAAGFKMFMERSTAGGSGELQIMYGCYGERRLTEVSLNHLEGYRGSRPVRIGNGASSQVQLDVYGTLLDAAHLWRLTGSPLNEDGWRFIPRNLVDAHLRPLAGTGPWSLGGTRNAASLRLLEGHVLARPRAWFTGRRRDQVRL